MSRQQGTGLPGSQQGMGGAGRNADKNQIDQKLTDEWRSEHEQGGAGEPRLQKEGEIDRDRKGGG
ncbi:hypothetical protein [Chthonobacter rhizosphaerae]|uniref:hypothetical protein n=1 Tax=Chthonobacter rhizosphaerae TaxID=2735553 RepID=UPI0015EFBA8C|nr:hypothetical protein [Chthonobacter rhizosphaerae]